MEPTSIPQRELRNNSAKVLREVQEGREFVITVRGRPVARLVPERSAERVGPRTFVPSTEAEAIVRRAREAFRGTTLQDIRDAVDDEMRY
jgi:prevent-host-death family protein